MGEIFAGRYELIDPIGRGGVGAVWRAWDARRRRYVAAKVLQQSDAHTLLRFVREQALRIDHPHVLAPASWAADDDKVLFTMDLVNGGSLAHLIGDYGPLPPRFVCVLLDQLLAGLTAVHAEGVVHRDIKPANILLEATGTGRPHLRLSDFGIAMRKGEPRLTEANYVVGTPGYFAPEQMLGAEPDFPADLFAVGLVALYLITGVKPDAEALTDVFAERGIPNAPEGVPEPLWQVLASLVHPDPEARFRTATGARKAILAAVELLPDITIEDEIVEVFDHIGPLPAGFGPDGPLRSAGGAQGPATAGATTGTASTGHVSMSDTGSFQLAPPEPSTSPTPTPAPAPTPVPPSPPGTAHTGHGATPTGHGATSTGHGSMPPGQVGPATGHGGPSTGHVGTPTGHGGTSAGHGAPAAPAGPVGPGTSSGMPLPPPAPAYEPTAAVHPEHSATRPYTAGPQPVPGRPPAGAAVAAPAAAPPAPYRRPGPPAKVAVPVLIVALLCIAVGVWALLTA
ncbi:serine/threonine-protein kinase [Streptomyces sp. 2333.5]|uniref:serine/threonine-protein kinase n=1 Tax=unclassified Streptomyces TaxID=2593676 RepID=UPI00089D8EB9|nr:MULTISPECIES: serine/threonine-protein kinase [unclassified Streptomyces]PJJ03166.1 serine/threonine-protein kinase [Streptomyces sp. 2333.5]SED55295.1 serine/threonine protein kinase [Streptomyces sp. 2314.4]SEE33676.1 serine/threonine protein kinase [Streptomyces sp. 2112.2]